MERDKPRSLQKIYVTDYQYGRGSTPSTKFTINSIENGMCHHHVDYEKMASPERDKPRSLQQHHSAGTGQAFHKCKL